MSEILTIDYTLLSSSLASDEIEVLQQYQTLAQNLKTVREKLDEINNKITNIHDDETMANLENLTSLSVELQKSLGVLGTMFKTTVHNVLMNVDSNQVVADSNIKISQENRVSKELVDAQESSHQEYGAQSPKSDQQRAQQQIQHIQEQQHLHRLQQQHNDKNQQKNQPVFNHTIGIEDDEDDEEDDDVDLGSGIDEETMNAVDRIQHELGISADDVDIHRQIADQLEIDNNDY